MTFVAFGVAIREWDTPIGGALMRDADDPSTVSDLRDRPGHPVQSRGAPERDARRIADALDDSGNTYPTFLDPLSSETPTLAGSGRCRWRSATSAIATTRTKPYVTNPDGSLLDDAR